MTLGTTPLRADRVDLVRFIGPGDRVVLAQGPGGDAGSEPGETLDPPQHGAAG